MVIEMHHAAIKQGTSYNYGMCDPRIWSFGSAARRAPGRSWDRPLALGPGMPESSPGLPPLRMRSTPVASPRMIDLVIAVERRGARLNAATKRQMKSPSGAVAGLNRQASRPARGAFSFERTTARNRGSGGLIIEIVPRRSMLADFQRHGDVVVRQGQAQRSLGRRYSVADWRY